MTTALSPSPADFRHCADNALPLPKTPASGAPVPGMPDQERQAHGVREQDARLISIERPSRPFSLDPAPSSVPSALGVMVQLETEDGPLGWLLPMEALLVTAVPGPIARSAHAPEGVIGIAGQRGQVLTVLDARYGLVGRSCGRPAESWLTVLRPHLGDSFALLWPRLVGLGPLADWTEIQPASDAQWVRRAWRSPDGTVWQDLDVERWLSGWMARWSATSRGGGRP